MIPVNEDFDKLLDKLTSSTRSPRGHFSARNSWELLEKRISPPAGTHKLWRIARGIAASILLCIASWYAYDYIQPVSIQTIATQAEVCTVTLPDKSKVTLNRYSVLNYPARFKGNKREVSLKGEAYFEVAKDAWHPFVVKAETVNIQVLGTHFNVEAYPGDAEVRTTLLEGSVAVSVPDNSRQIVLLPNESAVYNRIKNSLQHEITPESTNEIAWRNGDFLFDYQPLGEIVRQLSHAFNIQIRITEHSLENYRLRAHFSNGENLEQILTLLQSAGNFCYTRTNDTIIISTKPR